MTDGGVILEQNDRQLLRVRHGVMLVNRHDAIVGRSLAYYGEYFEQEAALFRQLVRPGDIVVDVGANIGAHAAPLAACVGSGGRVVAFEPVRMNFQLLCANVALNDLDNVDAIPEGLGEREATVLIADRPAPADGNLGALALSEIPGDRPVRVRRLDDAFAWPRLRFVKIDVEGMEAAVLRGAAGTIERFRPALYVENDRIDSSKELILLLDALEYDCYWFLPTLHNVNNFYGKTVPMLNSGFVDDGLRIHALGMGVNLLCLHRAAKANLAGLPKVLSADEHPCRREFNQRFIGNA